MKARSDAALSDIVGTMIMLGATVSVIGLVSVDLLSSASGADPPAPLAVEVHVRPGDTMLTLIHSGGPPMDEGDTRIVVSAGETTLHDDLLGIAGSRWELGESEVVPLSMALGHGQDVRVALVSITHATTIATANVHLPLAPVATVPGGAFSIDVMFDTLDPATSITSPAPIRVRASVSHAQGRLAIDSVVADLTAIDAAMVPLVDDGLAGDDLAGDGIFSGYSVVPSSAAAGTHAITVTAIDFDGALASATGTVTVAPSYGADGVSVTYGPDGTTVIEGNATGSFTGNTTIHGNVTNIFTNGSGTGGLGGSDRNYTGNFNGSFHGSSHGEFVGNFSGNFSGELREVMVYNKSLIRSFAHRITKLETGPSDSVTTEVKLKLVNDPIVMADGLTYTLKSVHVNYDWLKPGNTPWISLDTGGSGNSPWFCRDSGLHIYSLRADEEMINSFERNWDPIYYYFIITWQQVGGSGIHQETVSTTATNEYFTLRRTVDSKEVIDDGGWTTNYANCSNQ